MEYTDTYLAKTPDGETIRITVSFSALDKAYIPESVEMGMGKKYPSPDKAAYDYARRHGLKILPKTPSHYGEHPMISQARQRKKNPVNHYYIQNKETGQYFYRGKPSVKPKGYYSDIDNAHRARLKLAKAWKTDYQNFQIIGTGHVPLHESLPKENPVKTRDPKPPANMSNSELKRRYAALEKITSKLNDKLISKGFGNIKFSDLPNLDDKDAREYLIANRDMRELMDEAKRRYGPSLVLIEHLGPGGPRLKNPKGKAVKKSRKKNPISDNHVVTELVLYANNIGPNGHTRYQRAYWRARESLLKDLKPGHIKDQAVELAARAAMAYSDEFGDGAAKYHHLFTAAEIKEAAAGILDYLQDLAREMNPKKRAKKKATRRKSNPNTFLVVAADTALEKLTYLGSRPYNDGEALTWGARNNAINFSDKATARKQGQRATKILTPNFQYVVVASSDASGKDILASIRKSTGKR